MPLFSKEIIVYTEIQRNLQEQYINEFCKFVVHVQYKKKLYFSSKQLVNILQGQRQFIIASKIRYAQ